MSIHTLVGQCTLEMKTICFWGDVSLGSIAVSKYIYINIHNDAKISRGPGYGSSARAEIILGIQF